MWVQPVIREVSAIHGNFSRLPDQRTFIRNAHRNLIALTGTHLFWDRRLVIFGSVGMVFYSEQLFPQACHPPLCRAANANAVQSTFEDRPTFAGIVESHCGGRPASRGSSVHGGCVAEPCHARL